MSTVTAPLLAKHAADHRVLARRNAAVIIFVPALIVAIMTLAASTRSSEFLAISGFVDSEEYLAGGSILSPSKSIQILHSEIRQIGAELKLLDQTDVQLNQYQPMTAEEIDDNAVIWAGKHPKEHEKIRRAFLLGMLMGLIGFAILIASEIKSVLVLRELDREAMSEAPKTYDLEVDEMRWGRGFLSTSRVWFSSLGIFVMIAGSMVVLVPLCDVLEDFGLPGAVDNDDCLTTVLVVAIVSSLALGGLMVAIVWSCTRPWAALFLAGISIAAQVACALGSPPLILAWAVVSAVFIWYYFNYIPEGQEGFHPTLGRRPPPPNTRPQLGNSRPPPQPERPAGQAAASSSPATVSFYI